MPSCPARPRTFRQAFTLLEAVVVLAIIGILLGIAAISWNVFRQSSQNIAGESLLGAAQSEMRSLAASDSLNFPQLSALDDTAAQGRLELTDELFVNAEQPSVFPQSASGPGDFTVSVTQVSPLPNFIGYAVETNDNSCFTMLDRTVPGPGESTVSGFSSTYSECRIPASCVELFAIDPESRAFQDAAAQGFTAPCTLPPAAPLEAPTCLIAEVVDVVADDRTQDVKLTWVRPQGGDSPLYTYVVSRIEGSPAAADSAVADSNVNLLNLPFATATDAGPAATPAASAGVTVTKWAGRSWQGSHSWMSTFPADTANGDSLIESPPGVVIPGETYTFSTYLSQPARQADRLVVRPQVKFFDSSGTVVDSVEGSAAVLNAQFQQVQMTATAPQDAVTATVAVVLDTSTARLTGPAVMYSDGFLLNSGTAPAEIAEPVAQEFVAGQTDTYTDITARPGVTYTYRVFAQSVEGERYPASEAVTIATLPEAPAVTSAVNDAVNIVWPGVQGAGEYRVSRSLYSASDYTQVGVVPGDEVTPSGLFTYTDNRVTSGLAYTYRVTPVMDSGRLSVCGTIRNFGGPGPDGETVTGLPLAAPDITAELSSSAQTVTDSGQSVVTWSSVNGAVDGYELDFFNGETGIVPDGQTLPQGTYPRRFPADAERTDSFDNLAQGSLFVYRVRALGEVVPGSQDVPGGLDLSSPWASTELQSPLVAPVLSLDMADSTAGGGLADDAQLSWTPNPQATSYAIEYLSSTTGVWQLLQPTVYGTSYTDSNVPAGTARTYRVRAERNIIGAVSVNVTSDWSNEVSGSVPVPPVTNVACQVDNGDPFTGGDERVVVSWSGPADPYYLSDYFITAYVNGAEYAYTSIPASAGVTSWTQTPQGPGSWSYRVYAVSTAGISSPVASVSGCEVSSPLTLPDPPPAPPCRPFDPGCEDGAAVPDPDPQPAPGPDVVAQGGSFRFVNTAPNDPLSFTNDGEYTLKAQPDEVESVLLWLVDPNSPNQAERSAPTFNRNRISRVPDKVVSTGLGSNQKLSPVASGSLRWDDLADKDPWTASGKKAVYWVYALPVLETYTEQDAADGVRSVNAGRNGTLFPSSAVPVPDWEPEVSDPRNIYYFIPGDNQTKNVPAFFSRVTDQYQRKSLVKYDIFYNNPRVSSRLFASNVPTEVDGSSEFEYKPTFTQATTSKNLGHAENVTVRTRACAFFINDDGAEELWRCGERSAPVSFPVGPRVPEIFSVDFIEDWRRKSQDGAIALVDWFEAGPLDAEILYRPTLNGVALRNLWANFSDQSVSTLPFADLVIRDFESSESRMYGVEVQALFGQGEGRDGDFPHDFISPATNTVLTRNPAEADGDDGAGEYAGLPNSYTGWTGSYEMGLAVRVGTGGAQEFTLNRTESFNTSNGQVWCMDLGFAAPGADADLIYRPSVEVLLDGFRPGRSSSVGLSGMLASPGDTIEPGSRSAYRLAYLLNRYGAPGQLSVSSDLNGKATAVDYAIRKLTSSGSWQKSTIDSIWNQVKNTASERHLDRVEEGARLYSGPYTVDVRLFACLDSVVYDRNSLSCDNVGPRISAGSILDKEQKYAVEVRLKSERSQNVPDGWYVTPYVTQGVQPTPAAAVDGVASFAFIPVEADEEFQLFVPVVAPSPSVYARLPRPGFQSQRMLMGGVLDFVAEVGVPIEVQAGL